MHPPSVPKHMVPFVPWQKAGRSLRTATASPHLLHEVDVNVIHQPLLEGYLGLGEVSEGGADIAVDPDLDAVMGDTLVSKGWSKIELPREYTNGACEGARLGHNLVGWSCTT